MCTAAPPWAEVGTHPSQTAPRVARHCMRAAPSRRPRGSAPSRRRAPRLAHADSASTRAPRPAAARAHHPHQQSQKRDTERPKARPHLEARVLLQPHRRPDQVDRLNHQRRRRPDRRRRGSSDRGHFMSRCGGGPAARHVCTAQGAGPSHTRGLYDGLHGGRIHGHVPIQLEAGGGEDVVAAAVQAGLQHAHMRVKCGRAFDWPVGRRVRGREGGIVAVAA
jgi:hypothetical protein